jgi:hypothetical protein
MQNLAPAILEGEGTRNRWGEDLVPEIGQVLKLLAEIQVGGGQPAQDPGGSNQARLAPVFNSFTGRDLVLISPDSRA